MPHTATRKKIWTVHIVLLAVCLLATCGSVGGTGGDAGRPGGEADPALQTAATATGFTITSQVPFSEEGFEKSRALSATRSTPPAVPRIIPFWRTPRPSPSLSSGTTISGVPIQQNIPLADAPSHHAPVLSNGFSGLSDPGNVIPPDTMGAAGPSHLVSTLNSAVGVFNKVTGAKLSEVSLQGFWASLGTGAGQPANSPFDPKVTYDQNSGRFVIATLGGGASPGSWLLIAVSATSDPTGTWFKWAIDADKDNGVQTGNWADYPGLGIDNNNLYITANMFNNAGFYQHAKAWVFPKAQLLTGSNPITWTEFPNPPGVTGTLQPVHAYGATTTGYVVQEGNFSIGPPLRVSLKIASITFPGGTPTWTDLGHIQVNSYPASAALPQAPQAGIANLIDTGDQRFINAILRNGSIWAAHTVSNTANTRTEVAWYQINPAAASPVFPGGLPIQQGRISDPNRFYFYPSIAVNGSGDAAIGFSGSSTTEFASAFYTARAASAPAGSMQAVATLKAGQASYFKDFGSGSNRWGDYSATCVDPADDHTFWTLQEYAGTPANTWATWWGSFQVGPPTPATAVTLSASPAGPQTPGTSVTWTAVAGGGSGTYEYQVWFHNGAWSVVKDYAVPGNTWTWNTTGLADGKYYVLVYARSAGSAASVEALALQPYTLATPSGIPPATGVMLTPALPSPKAPGTSVTWTAAASGGSGTYEYQISFFNGAWTIVKDYTVPGNTWTWNTTGLADNTYYVLVYARSAGSTASVEALALASFNLVTPSLIPPATGVGLTPSPAGPQAPGVRNPVTWTALGQGGTGTYEYQIWHYNGAWSIVKDYNIPGNTWTWTTTGLPAGTYYTLVYVRNAGSTSSVEALALQPYDLQ